MFYIYMYGMQYFLFIFHELYFVTLDVVMDIFTCTYQLPLSAKKERRQRSEIDTIKYKTLHRTSCGNVTKTQEIITHKRAKKSVLNEWYLLAFLYVMFSCVCVTFQFGVLCQVWNLIVLIPDVCLFPY